MVLTNTAREADQYWSACAPLLRHSPLLGREGCEVALLGEWSLRWEEGKGAR